MTPTIENGECVVVAPVDATAVKLADVMLCRTRQGLAAHRVLSTGTNADGTLRFTTCGDAALETDPPVGGADVRGRVVSVEREGGTVDLSIWGGVVGRLAVIAAVELQRAVRRFRARAWLGAQSSVRIG